MFTKESRFPATKDLIKVSVKSAQSDYLLDNIIQHQDTSLSNDCSGGGIASLTLKMVLDSANHALGGNCLQRNGSVIVAVRYQ